MSRATLTGQVIAEFTERLGLIGKQVLQFRHMDPLAPDVEAIAVDLRDRFMPEVFATAAARRPNQASTLR